MRYLVLIYQSEAASAQLTEEQQNAEFGAYMAFSKEAQERGVLLGEQALMPTSSATTVRVRNGKISSTTGPFAETKEQLGGAYQLNCKNLDEAIELAAKIPAVTTGSIEIRPLMEFE